MYRTPAPRPTADCTLRVPTRLGSLSIRTAGSPDGPPTVLWPSMFVDSHTWDRLLPLLPADRSYLLVDPPGLGLSDPLRHESDIVGAADAAVDALEHLGLPAGVDWVGNAFGGHVGFELAARPGVLRSLAAISSPAEPVPAALRRQIVTSLPLMRALGPVAPVRESIVHAMLTDASAADPGVRQVVVDSLRRPTRRSAALAVRSFILNRVDVTPRLRDVTIPCLFVASDDRGDWSPEDAEATAALVPSARTVVVRGARTLVPLEQPSEVASLLRQFWAEA
ncbi:alpha/beta fold hydrolase [Aquipuribacter sp. SD81]|uniref:alpha/beta fold hydrolase n=1 Tax=Aquipuribacter sp. SD81 TaxID=3127703 RepID=UPI003017955A